MLLCLGDNDGQFSDRVQPHLSSHLSFVDQTEHMMTKGRHILTQSTLLSVS